MGGDENLVRGEKKKKEVGGGFRRGWGCRRSERDVGLHLAQRTWHGYDLSRLLLPRLLQAVHGYCCHGYCWHGYDCCANCRKFAAIAAAATIAAATAAAATADGSRLQLPQLYDCCCAAVDMVGTATTSVATSGAIASILRRRWRSLLN